jgi:hypothetical protein
VSADSGLLVAAFLVPLAANQKSCNQQAQINPLKPNNAFNLEKNSGYT